MITKILYNNKEIHAVNGIIPLDLDQTMIIRGHSYRIITKVMDFDHNILKVLVYQVG